MSRRSEENLTRAQRLPHLCKRPSRGVVLWTPAHDEFTGTVSDRTLGEAWGIHENGVYWRRRTLGVPAFGNSGHQMRWTSAMLADLRTHPDRPAAQRCALDQGHAAGNRARPRWHHRSAVRHRYNDRHRQTPLTWPQTGATDQGRLGFSARAHAARIGSRWSGRRPNSGWESRRYVSSARRQASQRTRPASGPPL
jgi:hypothetical protein